MILDTDEWFLWENYCKYEPAIVGLSDMSWNINVEVVEIIAEDLKVDRLFLLELYILITRELMRKGD